MLQLRGQHGAFRCAVTLLVCVVVAGRSDARRGDGSGMTDEEVVKWMEENPERLDEIMEEMTADMREEHQLAGHARQVALIQAAKTGNLDDIKFALREGCTLADRSDKNETALHLAAVWGHPHVVEYLIQEGIDVDAEDGHGQSALALASHYGEHRSVRAMIEAGADVNHQNPDGQTPLHAASFSNRASKIDELKVVNMLLDAGADHDLKYRNDAKTHHAGWRPIGVARSHKKKHIVDLLVSRLGLKHDEL